VDQTSLERILERARRHDPTALAELVDAYSDRLYGLLYRLTSSRETAEDLLQETFLRVVRMIDRYDPTGRFEAWLFRIAGNLARDHARQRRRRGTPTPLDTVADPPHGSPALAADGAGPDERLLESELHARLDVVLARMSAPDREILLLRHYSELSFREIADLLEVPLGTALARAHRALQRLRAELTREGVIDG
jgi:RNA polymerase sigma-70 factor (ECF subfamily)